MGQFPSQVPCQGLQGSVYKAAIPAHLALGQVLHGVAGLQGTYAELCSPSLTPGCCVPLLALKNAFLSLLCWPYPGESFYGPQAQTRDPSRLSASQADQYEGLVWRKDLSHVLGQEQIRKKPGRRQIRKQRGMSFSQGYQTVW